MASLIAAPVASAAWEEVAPELWRWSGTCNAWLLREGEAGLLIDLGDGSALDHLEEVGVKHLEWVILTGHHRELLQGIGALDRAQTRVAAPAAERELLESPLSFRKWDPRLRDAYTVHGSSYVRPPCAPVGVDRWLEDGEVFSWHGHALTCRATPGHSPGGLSLEWRKGEQLWIFSGGVMHDGARMTNWFDTEWDYGFGKGLDVLIETVDRLAAAEPEVMLPSQGPVIREATDQLRRYSERLQAFRPDYVRGYPVGSMTERGLHPATKPTPVPYVVEVTPHLYMFGPEMAGKNFAILIADNGHALLLDCGLFPKLVLDRILREMERHLGLKQIDACWISHSHGDHFTLFPALAERGVEFWTMEGIVDKCENPRAYDYPAMIGAYNAGFEAAKIDRVLREGEVIDWQGWKLHVDRMPGQTEFGNALWLELDGKRVVFTGDNLFGDPADATQNGHECVVARNSALIEEGYLLAAEYLEKLKPDILMGAHSVLMTEPAGFIGRYGDWARRAIRHYETLLPDEDYAYLFDPYWVSAYPYRVGLESRDVQVVTVTVRNFRDRVQRHRVELVLPPGLRAEPAVLEGEVAALSRGTFPVRLTVEDRAALGAGVRMVPMDITLDGRHYGQWFDFLIRAQEEPKE
ncbi:MAG: MBL fold metallo-hydrolase [Verrucomicrobiales bacterium]|nr:MBL fold metallo-hydrolase [Verrucomicrobiales bacterium]